MNEQKLSEATQALYDAGLDALRLLCQDNESERRRLMRACENVERLQALYRETMDLYSGEIKPLKPPLDNRKLQRLDREIQRREREHIGDARRYGWTPLARVMVRERHSRLEQKRRAREYNSEGSV